MNRVGVDGVAVDADMGSWVVLAMAFVAAGVLNALAGGGSFLTFPALLLTGLDARAANITSTLALFPMQVSTGFAGRGMAGDAPNLSFREMFIVSLFGGSVGAILLLLTPSNVFARMVPWLILFATLLFAYGSFWRRPVAADAAHRIDRRASLLMQAGISIYGGYFGGGIGFLMLAALTLAGMAIRKAGATKNILAAAMNAAAVLVFVFSNAIGWWQAAVGAAASMAGGALGVRLLHRVNERALRLAVVVIGLALTVAMFIIR